MNTIRSSFRTLAGLAIVYVFSLCNPTPLYPQSLVPGERFVWVGSAEPSDQETLALSEAIRVAQTSQWPEALLPLEQFTTNYPHSPWLPSVQSQLAKVYRDCG